MLPPAPSPLIMLNVIKQHLCMNDCELEGLKSTTEPKSILLRTQDANKMSAVTIRILRNKLIKRKNTAGEGVLYCYLKPYLHYENLIFMYIQNHLNACSSKRTAHVWFNEWCKLSSRRGRACAQINLKSFEVGYYQFSRGTNSLYHLANPFICIYNYITHMISYYLICDYVD